MRGAGELPSQSPSGDSSPEGRAKSRLPLWGALVPSGHRSALDRAGRREGAEPYGLALDLSGRQPERNEGNRGFAPPFPDGGAVSLSALLWRAPPPKGEARLGFLQTPGGLLTRLPLWGRYVPVGRCPAADRGGSRDAGTAAAVTERATAPPSGKGGAKGPCFPSFFSG